MSKDILANFNKQLAFEPKIENESALVKRPKIIIAGMGGSNLASGLLKIWNPALDIVIHRDYGLPNMAPDELENCLVIASSYSGNTEETISALETAIEKSLPVAVISTGGKLLDIARQHNAPFIRLPDTGIEPRLASGFFVKSFLKIIGEGEVPRQLSDLADSINPSDYESQGKDIAEKIKNKIPVIYASVPDAPLAYIWKVDFNETAAIPAFCNAFPELNHNEMAGFGDGPLEQLSAEKFHFLFLRDDNDSERIKKRMDLTAKLFKERGFGVEAVSISGATVWHKIFGCVLTGHWTAFHLAENYKTAGNRKIIEDFKRSLG